MAIAMTMPRRGVSAATLLNAVTSTSDGEWVDVTGLSPMTITVQGITTATVQVRYSNSPTRPANSVHGIQAGTDLTADGGVVLQLPCRWAKCRVSAYTSGTITAELVGVSA